jgi:H+/Cl- antiporter ClcA
MWHKALHALGHLGNDEALGKLSDFTVTPRMFVLAGMAFFIGIISAFAAWILLRLIGFFTNLFFFQRIGTSLASPAANTLGMLEILVPVIGGLIVGLMARYGSERIRGHGIPEAIEAILINGSKMEPKVALLKPVSSAISIGSGGPFGAEGPIIVTGGAIGSMIAQFFHLSSTERRILLVAGAAGGMSATFSSPIAAILLAVELLLFEWKPRSLVPVAVSSVTAYAVRYYILGAGPLFPTPVHPGFIGPVGLLSCVLVGILAAALSIVLTLAVYASEDGFRKLPIHWMWWPIVGGVVVGIGGLIFPHALGVGYDNIGHMLAGNASIQFIVGILVVKSIIWSVSLGSGTSGGIIAPLLMVGCALGGVEALFLPHEGLGFWSLVSMGAVIGAAMNAPFMAIIFSLELTHDLNAVVPLAIAVFVAHALTSLLLSRSILTEKISRRGYHLSREYSVDPLEILFVREVMRTNIVALASDVTSKALLQTLRASPEQRTVQRLYPVLGENKHMIGVITRKDLQKAQQTLADHTDLQLSTLMKTQPAVTYPDEPLRAAVNRMAETGFTRLPVVQRDNPQELVGIVSLNDLLKARVHNLTEERHRERILRLHLLFPFPGRSTSLQHEVREEQKEPEDTEEELIY